MGFTYFVMLYPNDHNGRSGINEFAHAYIIHPTVIAETGFAFGTDIRCFLRLLPHFVLAEVVYIDSHPPRYAGPIFFFGTCLYPIYMVKPAPNAEDRQQIAGGLPEFAIAQIYANDNDHKAQDGHTEVQE